MPVKMHGVFTKTSVYKGCLYQQKPYARITIKDNGIGISKEVLPHIFNRFYRADHSRTRPNGGTGLGLAIAKQNIAVHHGLIEVESKEGQGTSFTVYLPIEPV